LSSAPCSKIPSSVNVRDQVSHPYKATNSMLHSLVYC
jgi:hypothetical protein